MSATCNVTSQDALDSQTTNYLTFERNFCLPMQEKQTQRANKQKYRSLLCYAVFSLKGIAVKLRVFALVAWSLILLIQGEPCATAQPIFPVHTKFVDGVVEEIAKGDFNGDGKIDIASTNHYGSITILLNKGDGTFAEGIVSPADKPYAVAVGDFNRDGKLDLAVTNNPNDTVSILIGNGNGTFVQTASYPVNHKPRSVAVGDFDGDGWLDLVTTNNSYPTPDTVSVLRNNGDGTFAPQVDFYVGVNVSSVVVADFNRDGKPDIATVQYGSTISILLNAGGINFLAHHDYPTPGFYTYEMAVGDVNNDGLLDLVNVSSTGSLAAVYLNNAAQPGDFLPKVTYPVEFGADKIALSDVDRDGSLDIVVTNYSGYSISVLHNNGNGTFAPKTDYRTGNNPVSLAAADFDGDGKPDVAVGFSGNTVGILHNDNGAFRGRQQYTPGSSAREAAAVDLNGDGKPDIVTASSQGNTLAVLLNDGTGNYLPPTSIPAGNSPQAIASGDFNRDGVPDIVVANRDSSTLSVFPGIGDGTFAARTDYPTADSPLSVAVGDLNGDGFPDLVTTGSGKISVLLAANGDFQRTDYSLYGVAGIALSDIDSDGRLDIVTTSHNNGTMNIFRNIGGGVFMQSLAFTANMSPAAVAVGDLNGDGKPDIVTANNSVNDGSISVFRNTGGLTFVRTDYLLRKAGYKLALGDFDGDGSLDVAALDNTTIGIFCNLGGGTFAPRVDYLGSSVETNLASSDLDGDGTSDLIISDFGNTLTTLQSIAPKLNRVEGTLTLQGVSPLAGSQVVTFDFRAASGSVQTRQALVAPDGHFRVSVPAGSYTLHISAPKYLAKNVAINALTGNVSGITATLRAGDGNGDNVVDVSDLLLIINHYNQRQANNPNNYLEACDFNSDGANDVTDLLLVIGNYNAQGDS